MADHQHAERDAGPAQYGLPDARDRDGRLRPVDYEFDWKGQSIRVKFLPPTATEVSEWEEMGEDMSPSQMADVLDDKLIQPEIERPYSLEELVCYVRAIAQYAMEDSDIAEEVDAELAERSTGHQGN